MLEGKRYIKSRVITHTDTHTTHTTQTHAHIHTHTPSAGGGRRPDACLTLGDTAGGACFSFDFGLGASSVPAPPPCCCFSVKERRQSHELPGTDSASILMALCYLSRLPGLQCQGVGEEHHQVREELPNWVVMAVPRWRVIVAVSGAKLLERKGYIKIKVEHAH